MWSLKLLLLLLMLLGSSQAKSCSFKATHLKIISGTFKGVSKNTPQVQIMVAHANLFSKRSETSLVKSETPEWNQTLTIKKGGRGFLLFAKINGHRPRYICYVTNKEGDGTCNKRRGGATYSVKYSISC